MRTVRPNYPAVRQQAHQWRLSARARRPPTRCGSAATRWAAPTRHGGRSMTGEARLLFGGAACGVPADLGGTARVAVGARDREFQHPRHGTLAEDRVAEDLVMHVAPLRDEPGVLDVAYDL